PISPMCVLQQTTMEDAKKFWHNGALVHWRFNDTSTHFPIVTNRSRITGRNRVWRSIARRIIAIDERDYSTLESRHGHRNESAPDSAARRPCQIPAWSRDRGDLTVRFSQAWASCAWHPAEDNRNPPQTVNREASDRHGRRRRP